MSFDISRLKNLEVNKYSKPYEEDRTKLPMNNTQNVNLPVTNQNKFLQFNEFNNTNQNPFLSLAKTVTGTGTDILQDVAKGFISPIENVADVGVNALASVQDLMGFKNEAQDVRNFANRDLSGTISKRAAQSTLPGVAYNLFNGTPQNIINNAGVEIDTNKSFGENVGNAFNKIFNNDDTSNIEGYEKSSILGEYPDKLNELIGYTFGLSTYGNVLGGLGKTAEAGGKAKDLVSLGTKSLGLDANLGNIGVNIAGHTLNVPTLAVAGGMAGGLQEANSKENVSEFERWGKALSSGAIEGVTEGIFGLMGIGGSDITDKFASKLAGKFSSSAGKMLSKLGVQASGEATEEFLSYVANYFVDNGLINKLGDANFENKWDWKELGEQMALAFVSAGISGGSTTVLGNNAATKSAEQQLGRPLTMQEKAQITQAVIDENVNERINNLKNENQLNLPIANQNVPLNQTQNAQQQVQQQTTLPMQKMAQNQTSEQLPVSYKNQAENEIKNAKISENEKNMMLDVLNNLPEVSQKDLQDIKTQINQMTQVTNEMNKLPTKSNYREDSSLKQKYMQYKNDNGNYNTEAVDQVLDMIPENRNGKRTVKQWTQVANEIGQRIADLSNEEIERIAYKSWFDIEPKKNITRYDRQTKSNASFSRFDSDTWINNVYDGVNKARQNAQQVQPTQETPIKTKTNNKQVSEEDYLTHSPNFYNGDQFDFNKHRTKITNEAISDLIDVIDNSKNLKEDLYKAYQENEQSEGANNKLNTGLDEDNRYKYQYKETMLSDFIDSLNRGEDIKQSELYKEMKKQVPVETKQEPTLLKDKDGNVLKVYHGSPNSNISQFDSNLAGRNTQSDFSGIFFTDNPNVAEDFSYEQLPGNSNLSYKRGKKGSVYEKNLSYKNVLNLNEINESNIDQLEKYLDEKKGSKEEALNMMKQMANYNNAQGIKFYLDLDKVKNDYDLIIADMGGTYKGSNEYIVFDNSQIKDIEQKVENNLKQQQLDIIQKSNPMTDNYHQGIRDVNDIKTFEEAMEDDESFVYGDFTLEDAKKALEKGKVTVYSSHPIEQGSFVSTSQNMAKDYAGNGQIYSQEVNLDDVAWINGDEGQYAKVVANNQNTLYNNNESESELNGEQGRNTNEIQRSSMESKGEDAFSVDRYKQEEKSIREKGKVKYTNKDKIFAEKMKNKYNKKIFIFDDSNTSYGGGLSYIDNDTILFGRNALDNYGYDFLEGHEILEDINKNYSDIAGEILNDLKNKLQNDNGFGNTFLKYLADMDEDVYSYYIDKPEIVAKEIIGDLNGLRNANMDYSKFENYKDLDSKLVDEIQNKILELENKIYTNNQDSNKSSFNLPMKQQTQTKTESVLPMTENQKFRKHYESIIQSDNTTPEAKAIAKELMDTDTYVPESNTKQLERADKRIETAGADSELNSLMSRAMTGGNIKADDIAVGERLIQYYSKTGDKVKLQEAIRATAMAGTTAGQTVQAMSLLNHQTPEGQAIWLQRSVEKMNNDLKKRRGQNADQFNLTEDMLNKIVNSNNAEELQQNLNEVYDELGQQVSKSTIEKLDAWRYFSMLANPKTHIRNIVGNLAMGKTQSVKNKIAGALEGAVAKVNPNIERTRTLKKASKEVKQFAKNDIKNVADRLELNDNKYNPKTRLENSMRTFKSNALENTLGKLFEFNNKALEVEDAWGLKSAYTRSLSEYMTANKLTPDNITDKQLAKARNFAIEQAKEATFHQASALATAINQFSNKNGLTKFVADSVVPFKKTPINVAKAGLEYSPAGLAKSAIYDTVQLRKGNITVNQYIDNISKGLTGSGIALLGYALAEAGILKASGGDDDKEKYDQDRGMQTYSIQIGDNTYSLDWLAPVGIPLFIGAEVHNIMKKDEETKTSTSSDDDKAYNQAIKSVTNILDAFTNAMNPMTEMSMLSGLTSALKSYDGDNAKMLANLGVNTSKSYVNQFVPTALGQVAKTTDEYERSTTSTQTGTLPKAIDSTKNQIMAKIPGLRQMLPTKTDTWGNDLKQPENVVQRTFENAVLPFVRKEIQNSEVDKELTRLYDSTGESGILPDSINKNLTINKEKYVMTSDEYAKYKKQYGQTAYDLIDNLVTSKDYKNMTDEQKTTAVENIYKYANEQIKDDYAKENNLDYELSTMSNVANKLNKSDKDDYFEFTAKTKDLNKDSEKLQVLADSNYSNKAKETIYENSLGKNDNLYDTMKLAGIDINEYLNYKTQEFTSDKEDDGTTTGKSVSGSKKAKVVDYVQNMNIPYNQKLLLLATQYSLTTSEKSKVANYVNSLKTTKANKLKIYESLSGFTVYKDGRVTW